MMTETPQKKSSALRAEVGFVAVSRPGKGS